MKLVTISESHQTVFDQLLTGYYREGEDADTPQAELDDFISYLFGLCTDGTISGAIAFEDKPVGFVLWNIDTEGSPFSNLPGHGTMLEIGVVPEARRSGLGRTLAAHAEAEMSRQGVEKFYVCAYGPAIAFWEKLGYKKTDMIAENDLPIYAKGT